MIQLSQVGRSFGGAVVLDQVDLAVRAGERVALVGPSGSGKTTLFRILNLSIRPDRGAYLLDGGDVARLRGRDLRIARTRIATIHQHHDVVERLSVCKNILAGRLGQWSTVRSTRAFLFPRAGLVEEAREVAGRVGLERRLFQRSDRLSGGERQRVAIARAIFQDARWILADEPVASLDPVRAAEILELLVSFAARDRRTLLVSLHQPALARQWFERIVGLRAGRVAFDLPAGQVEDELLSELFGDDATEAGTELAEGGRRISRPACRPTDV